MTALQMSVADYRAHVAATRAKFFPPVRPVILRTPPPMVVLALPQPDPEPPLANENDPPPAPVFVPVKEGDRCPVGFPSAAGTYTMPYLLALTAYVSGISVETLKSERRSDKVAKARQVYCWLCTKYGPEVNRSLPNIGRTINRDHTTVLHAMRKVAIAAKELGVEGNPRELAEQLIAREWPRRAQ